MNEDVIMDLKQFITGAITQQTSDIRQDIRRLDNRVGKLESKVDSLEIKVDDGFAAIAEILEDMNTRNAALETYAKNHTHTSAAISQ